MIISINLLPEDRRVSVKSKNSREDTVQLRKIVLACVLLAAINIAGFAGIKWTQIHTDALDRQLEILQPDVRTMQVLKSDLNKLKLKTNVLSGLIDSRFVWARLLEAIANILPSGIWLDEISFKTIELQRVASAEKSASKANAPSQPVNRQILFISGYALTDQEDGTALVGKFIQYLKDDSRLVSLFDKVDLVSIRKKTFKENEVMNFKISCTFAKDIRHADI